MEGPSWRTSNVPAREFREDLSQKVQNLRRLEGHDFGWPDLTGKRLLLVGMGSSYFAARALCHRLQLRGINAYSFLASARDMPTLRENDQVIAITATGNSVETRNLISQLSQPSIVLTADPVFSQPGMSQTINLHSLEERGGVACHSYIATLVALLQLEEELTGESFVQRALALAIESVSAVWQSQDQWLQGLCEHIARAEGTQFVAPLERLCSADQSALMIREGPRIGAEACEVGDWAHINVYLTKNRNLSLVVFAGSPWLDQLLDWTTERKRRVVLIGGNSARCDWEIHYPHEDNPEVALLTESAFAELASAHLWEHPLQ